AGARGELGKVADVDLLPVAAAGAECDIGREVHRSSGGQHLDRAVAIDPVDLSLGVGCHVNVVLDVDRDAIGSPEITGRTGEDTGGAGAAVLSDRNPDDRAKVRVVDQQVTGLVELNPVGPQRAKGGHGWMDQAAQSRARGTL